MFQMDLINQGTGHVIKCIFVNVRLEASFGAFLPHRAQPTHFVKPLGKMDRVCNTNRRFHLLD